MTTQNKTFRPCVIHVGDNQALSAAVQRELFSRGYTWLTRRPTEPNPSAMTYAPSAAIYCKDNGQLMFGDYQSSVTRPRTEDGLLINLITQPFGALLEYLDKSEEVKVQVYGCATTTVHQRGAAFTTGSVMLRFLKSEREFLITEDEIDELYAASQAARKEGK